MVTVELAGASVLVAGIVVFVAWVMSAFLLLDQCQLTANEVARQVARADNVAVARAISDAPAAASVQVAHSGQRSVVTVRAEARFGSIAVAPLEATAVVLDEARP